MPGFSSFSCCSLVVALAIALCCSSVGAQDAADPTSRLFVVGGGIVINALASAEVLDTAAAVPKWTPYASMSTARWCFAAVTVGSRIFVLGGIDDHGFSLASVVVLDTAAAEPKWESYASLSTKSAGFATVAVGSRLFAIGATNGSPSASVEVLDTAAVEPKWSPYASMSTARWEFAAVAVGSCIFALGGKDGNNNPLASVEVLNTTAAVPKWTPYASMSTVRSYLAAVAVGSRLFAVGGWNGTSKLALVEVLDTAAAEPKWNPYASMSTARWNFAAMAIGSPPDAPVQNVSVSALVCSTVDATWKFQSWAAVADISAFPPVGPAVQSCTGISGCKLTSLPAGVYSVSVRYDQNPAASATVVAPVIVNALPSAVVGNVSVARPAPGQLHLEWECMVSNNITGYLIAWQLNGQDHNQSVSSSSCRATLSLPEPSVYLFKVAAINRCGVGPWSSPSQPISSVPVVASAEPSCGSMTVRWSPSFPGSAAAAQPVAGGKQQTCQGTESCNITGLVFGQYKFRVVFGQLPASDWAVCKTAVPTAPTAPGLPLATKVGEGTKLQWSCSEPQGSAITGYRVLWHNVQGGGGSRIFPGSTCTAVVPSADSVNALDFEVRSISSCGESLESSSSNSISCGVNGQYNREAGLCECFSGWQGASCDQWADWKLAVTIAGGVTTSFSVLGLLVKFCGWRRKRRLLAQQQRSLLAGLQNAA